MSSSQEMDIVYTIVDEAPELASGSLLPIIKAFTSSADIRVGSKDISLSCLLYTSPSPRDVEESRMPSSA